MKTNLPKYIKIIAPALLSIVLFVLTIFMFIIPYFKDNLLLKKREMIKELTNNALSILSQYNNEYKTGHLTLEEAQDKAKRAIKMLRYGSEGLDYFWITDLQPKMIMHPYIESLNEQDLSDYQDPEGKRLFVEAVRVVNKKEQGYINYMWQWKDDSTRIVPKVSFVKLFKPWNWIVGTGIYVEDVEQEISAITTTLVKYSAMIIVVVSLLLTYITRRNILLDRKKEEIDRALQASKDKYKKLVEASSDGSLMVLNDEIVYKNRHFCELAGYSFEEDNLPSYHNLFTLEFSDELFDFEDNTTKQVETKIVRKSGELVDIVLGLSKIRLSGKTGYIFLVKDVSQEKSIADELDMSKEKYEALLSNIDIGVFRLEWPGMNIVECNDKFLELLGLPEGEINDIEFEHLFIEPTEFESVNHLVKSTGNVKAKTVTLKRTDNNFITVDMSIVKEQSNNKTHYFAGTINDITKRKLLEEERENLIIELQASLLFMNQPIKNFRINHIFCDMNETIQKAVGLMSRQRYSALLVYSDNNPIGIITDRDIRERLVAVKTSPGKPVYEIMSSPIVSIRDNALVFEAIMKMQQNNIRHLAIKDARGEISGIISDQEIINLQSKASGYIIQEIQSAELIEDIRDIYQKLPLLIKAMLHSGARVKSVTRIIAAVSDTITEKIIEYGIDATGQPPCKFSFINLGSQGRDEQTLATDQDNGIIFEDVASEKVESCKKYFLELGRFVSDKLNDIGYNYCKGGVMATNEKWCLPLNRWKEQFNEWINNSNPQDLLETSIFFDLKGAYGDKALADELRQHIYDTATNKNVFFFHLARQALQFKPPLSFFGNIVTEESIQTHEKYVNIKKIIIPIVSFARVYTLKNNIFENNTLNRLKKLNEKHVISNADHEELDQTYNFLMILRLKHQIAEISENKEPDNNIHLEEFSEIEKTTLKKALSTISNFQSKLNFDFKGGIQ